MSPRGSRTISGTGGNNSVRIVEAVSITNFTVEVRFQSTVEIGNQDEGILVEQDGSTFLRFDVLYDGAVVRLFSAEIKGSHATTFVNTPIAAPNAPIWLRLKRSGSTWTGSWSSDGISFNVVPSFTPSLNVTKAGPYAGTFGSPSSKSPAFTAIVDYFFNTANRLVERGRTLRPSRP